MKLNNPIENLSETDLRELIQTLEDDLAAMPAPDYFDWDGARGFYEETLRKAQERLEVLTSGKSDV